MVFDEWNLYKLKDFAEVQNGFAFKASDFVATGIPVIKIKNIVDGGVEINESECYNGEISKKLKPFVIRKNDILISMTGSHVNQIASAVGKVGRYKHDAPSLMNQRVGKIIVTDTGICFHDYLFYLLNRRETQYELAASAGGSANQANISPKQIGQLSMILPPISIQKKIASFLSSIDEKIELNRQTNQTLEAIAQAIFKEWFVDFNFPGATGEMQDSELGKIPKGWKVSSLDKIADFLNGIALQKFPAKSDTEYLPVIKIRELKNGVTPNTDRASKNIPSKYIVEDGDLLFSWSGTLEVKFWVGGKGALNQHLFKVTSTKYPSWYSYLWILYHLSEFKRIAEDKTTTMGHIQRKHLSEALCLIPNNIKEFDKLFQPIIEQQIHNEKQNDTLVQLRDTLLPKLMKGEITIKDSEKLAATVL